MHLLQSRMTSTGGPRQLILSSRAQAHDMPQLSFGLCRDVENIRLTVESKPAEVSKMPVVHGRLVQLAP